MDKRKFFTRFTAWILMFPMLFSPNMTLTRGMVVTVLYRLEGSPEVKELSNPFNDVVENKWYSNAVKWAAANGIINGYGNGKFGPEDNITRQDLAVIISRYADMAKKSLSETKSYQNFKDDADIANYAKEAIEKLFHAKIINGKPDNIFDPKGEATRAEFAAMLQRFLESIKK